MTTNGYMARGPDRLEFRQGKKLGSVQVRRVGDLEWYREEYQVDLLNRVGWVIEKTERNERMATL